MKKANTKSTFLLSISILLTALLGCSGGRGSVPSSPNEPPQPESQPNINSPTPQEPSMPRKPDKNERVQAVPDIEIISVSIDGSRRMRMEVKNNSTFGAIFSTSCDWTCPMGNIRNWHVDIEKGTYLGAGQQRTIGGTPGNLGCEPLLPSLNVKCKIEWGKGKDIKVIKEWSGEVAVP